MTWTTALLLISVAAILGGALAQLMGARRQRTLRTELAEAQDELRTQQSSQAQIIHTTKLASLGQMVAGVTHEINTPLGFVKSNVEVVRDLLDEHGEQLTRLMQAIDLIAGADAETLAKAKDALQRARVEVATASPLVDAKDLLGDSLEGIKTISNLVQNLKGFARVDRDGMDMTDLNDSVRSALAVAGHQLRDRVQVVTRLAPLPKVHCMPSQINQVFLNLITNAAQAIDEQGHLIVTSRATDSAVEVSIADNGRGIPDDVLPRIFDPFFTTKPVGEGTGLGLSIVHKIIKSHGGAIHVRTAVGKGTTFTISLPIASAKPAAPVPTGKAA
jgi:signal transduction histidine kinase